MNTIKIITQYAPRANSNVGKIVAKALGRQKSHRYDQSLSSAQNHRAAAQQMLAKLLGPEASTYEITDSPDDDSRFARGWVATRIDA